MGTLAAASSKFLHRACQKLACDASVLVLLRHTQSGNFCRRLQLLRPASNRFHLRIIIDRNQPRDLPDTSSRIQKANPWKNPTVAPAPLDRCPSTRRTRFQLRRGKMADGVQIRFFYQFKHFSYSFYIIIFYQSYIYPVPSLTRFLSLFRQIRKLRQLRSPHQLHRSYRAITLFGNDYLRDIRRIRILVVIIITVQNITTSASCSIAPDSRRSESIGR